MEKNITVSVQLDTNAEKAWEYWTHPDYIVQWNFASDEWCCPSASNDVSEGGKLSWRMEAKDGTFGFDLNGTYTKVVHPQQLEYMLEDGRPVRVHFETDSTGTTVKWTFEVEQINPPEFQKAGWQAILNNYKALVDQES